PSTFGPPWEDARISFQEALAEISEIRRLTLVSPEGRLLLQQAGGVEALFSTASAALALSVAALGLSGEYSLGVIGELASSTYVHLEKSLDVRRLRLWHGEGARSLFRAIAQGEVELILLAGGTEGGMVEAVVELAKDLALLYEALPGKRGPRIVYLGNSKARPILVQILGSLTELTMVDNPLPQLGKEDSRGAAETVEEIWLQSKLLSLPGVKEISSWSGEPIRSTLQGFSWAIEYLSQEGGFRTLGLDLGASTSSAVWAGEGLYRRRLDGIGLGDGLVSLLSQVDLNRLRRWLPFAISSEELEERLRNKALLPASIPSTREELLLEQAAAREIIPLLLEGMLFTIKAGEESELIVARGSIFSSPPNPRQAAMILLDGLQPRGLSTLALDNTGLLPAMGLLARRDPLAAAQALAHDGLRILGTTIAPWGKGSEGKPALSFKVAYAEGGYLEGEVNYGALEVIPLAPGQRASVKLHPARGLDVGLGRKGRAASLVEVQGGEVGLIIDARGRPLAWPADEEGRRVRIQEWMAEIGFWG
ncbi:MAG: glutamate mutase L, partial [Chloroflexi bacterium]|nr:glutamate mutase L [Chloroflexota bacterium]